MPRMKETLALLSEIARLDARLDEREIEIERLKIELRNKESLLNILRIHIEKSYTGRN